MAIHNNGSSANYYTITDHANLTLPNGDWSVGFWYKLVVNTGTSDRYWLATNNAGIANTFGLYLREAGAASDPSIWRFYFGDSAADTLTIKNTTTISADGKWRLVVAQRAGANFELWVATYGGTAVREGTTGVLGAVESNGSTWYITRRPGGSALASGNLIAEIFKIDSALTGQQITALATGLPITRLVTPIMYLPLYQADATIPDLMGNHPATRTGTTVTGEHAPVRWSLPLLVYSSGIQYPEQNVTLGTAQTGAGIPTTFVTQQGSLSLSLAQATTGSHVTDVTPTLGTLTLSLLPASTGGQAQGLTVLLGGVSVVLLATATGSSTTSPTVTYGTLTLTLGNAAMGGLATDLTSQQDSLTLSLGMVESAITANALSVTLGGVSVALSGVQAGLQSLALSVVYGSLTLILSPVSMGMTSLAETGFFLGTATMGMGTTSLTPVLGTISLSLTPAAAGFTTANLTATLGTLTLSLLPVSTGSSTTPPTVILGILTVWLSDSATGVHVTPVTSVLGGFSYALSAAVTGMTAVATEQPFVLLTPASMGVHAFPLAVELGSLTLPLQTANMGGQIVPLSVTAGALTLLLTPVQSGIRVMGFQVEEPGTVTLVWSQTHANLQVTFPQTEIRWQKQTFSTVTIDVTQTADLFVEVLHD